MKIIKGGNFAADIRTIVGEMLNIEASAQYFRNGELLVPGKDLPISDINGYPRMNVDGSLYTFKCYEGYVFVPPGFNSNVFIEHLMFHFAQMEKQLGENHLKDYQCVKHNYHTNIKVKSALSLMANGKLQRRNNVKRQFKDTYSDTSTARFTWYICDIRSFDNSITLSTACKSISRFVASIYYDVYDVCILDTNSITMEFNDSIFKGNQDIVQTPVFLTSYGDHIRSMLYDTKLLPNSLRNIDKRKVYTGKYEELPLRVGNSKKGHCYLCNKLLYDENYVLWGDLNSSDGKGVPICPICMHSSDANNPLENDYQLVLRVKFPVTAHDAITASKFPDDVKDILREALKGIKKMSIVIDGVTVPYASIGDKYVAFKSTDDYLYMKYPFNDKKICKLESPVSLFTGLE